MHWVYRIQLPHPARPACPKQEEEKHVLITNFPPTGLDNVILLRDTLVGYARTYPVGFTTACALCWAEGEQDREAEGFGLTDELVSSVHVPHATPP